MTTGQAPATDRAASAAFGRAAVWPLWALGRAGALVMFLLPNEGEILTDVRLYHQWALGALEGIVPGRDFPWEYPPGAFAFVAAPWGVRTEVDYALAFIALMLACDAVVLWVLTMTRQAGGPVQGLIVWLLVLPLLGPVSYVRLDLPVTALCVLGISLALSRPAWSGAAIAGATLVKLWPALLLVPLVAARRRLAPLVGFAVALTLGSLLATAVGVIKALPSSIDIHLHRGVQVESLAALPWLWARALGGTTALVFRQNAHDVDSRAAESIGTALSLTAFVLISLLLWQIWRTDGAMDRATLFDLCALIMTLVLLGGKVFSPQYLIWLFGVLALALATTGRFQRALPVCLVGVAALTHAVFPILYEGLLTGAALPLLALTARDLLLVAVGVMVFLRWRGRLAASTTETTR